MQYLSPPLKHVLATIIETFLDWKTVSKSHRKYAQMKGYDPHHQSRAWEKTDLISLRTILYFLATCKWNLRSFVKNATGSDPVRCEILSQSCVITYNDESRKQSENDLDSEIALQVDCWLAEDKLKPKNKFW